MSNYSYGGDDTFGGKKRRGGGAMSSVGEFFGYGGRSNSSGPTPLYFVLMGVMVFVVLVLSLISVFKPTVSRMSQPAVGITYTGAAHPDKTRLDAANMGAGTYDAPLGTPEYSDEAAQVANAQLNKAKSGFRSRFYNSRADGVQARYVPFKSDMDESADSAVQSAAAATEYMAGKQDAGLLAAMAGR